MGAWDVDPFGNDTACDWAYELDDIRDLSVIEETLEMVEHVSEGDVIDSDTAEQAVAAADTLARLRGKFYAKNPYTERVDLWVEHNPAAPTRALLDRALRVLERIMEPQSELRELWEESDCFSEWQESMNALKNRLV